MTFAKGEEGALSAAILGLDGAVLVAWEHKAIRAIAIAIAGPGLVPQVWPDDRFDMVWSLTRTDSGWALLQVPQLLLSNIETQFQA